MPIKEVRKVCFAGAGTMGCYNSLIAALSGYNVALYDVSEEALEQLPERQSHWSEILIELGVADHNAVRAAAAAIIRTTDPEKAARDADFFSESVFELLDVKRRTHQQFDALLPPHAIMTTNTSTLLLSRIESAVQRDDKFAAMHAGPRQGRKQISGLHLAAINGQSRDLRLGASACCQPKFRQ